MRVLYTSPHGNGDGTSGNPANYRSPVFWDGVRAHLNDDDVHVVFRSGEYLEAVPARGTSDRIGHPDHELYLAAETIGSVVIRLVAGANRDSQPQRFRLYNAYNVTLRGMRFTGPGTIDYVVRVRGDSNHVTIEDCQFEGLPGVLYGATGTADPLTRNIQLLRCSFRDVGFDSHAHMMYNAYGSHHLTIRDCRFEECAGDYVRFRDEVSHCVVDGCTFVHRGDVYATPYPFIAVPVFNDCQPGTANCPDPLDHPQYEYFGTHFVIRDNDFLYRVSGTRAFVLEFLHKGWDPPRRFHLLTQAEGQLLRSGSAVQRRTLLKARLGIDLTEVRFYGNELTGERYTAAFESYAGADGATSSRWRHSGRWEAKGATAVNLSDLLNTDPVRVRNWFEAGIVAID